MRVNPTGIERRSAREAVKTRRQKAKRRSGPKPKRIDRTTDPHALEAIVGLDAAIIVAAEYGMEIRTTRLAGRGNKLDGLVCEMWACPRLNDPDRRERSTAKKIRAMSVQLAKWFPATGLLILAGNRSWTMSPIEVVTVVASRCELPRLAVKIFPGPAERAGETIRQFDRLSNCQTGKEPER